jgi:hypothetical protein
MRDADVATTFATGAPRWRLATTGVASKPKNILAAPGFCFPSYPQRQTTASRRMTYCGTTLNFANIVPCSAASSLML